MKTLVAYYSRSDNNKKIASEIAKILGAHIDEIIPEKDYNGFIGGLRAGFNSFRKKTIKINSSKDPSKYKLVVVGGPLWVGNLNVPMRSYLTENKFKKLAFFSCCGKGESQKSLKQLQDLDLKPIATLFLSEKQIKDNLHHNEVIGFCNKIKNSGGKK